MQQNSARSAWWLESEFPPDPPGLNLLLGYDEVGLATACAWEFYAPGDEPPMHYVWALARANRVHGTDYAFRTLEEVLRRCRVMNEAMGQERGAMVVVNSANFSSMQLLRNSGFEPLWRNPPSSGDDEEAPEEETWGISLYF